MTLEEWWESLAKPTTFSEHDAAFIWQAAQQAERERIMKIVADVDKQEFVDDDWYSCCATIVEKIKNELDT